MVLVYSLSHGHYSGSSFIVPNNVILISYTNPRKVLNFEQNHAFASKFLNKVGDHLEIKKELLDLEYNDNTIEITAVPAIEITELRHSYRIQTPSRIVEEPRFIGQTTYPTGKFYITPPCTEADDLLITFSLGASEEVSAKDSIYSIPNTYMQVPGGCIIKTEDKSNTRILLSTWLNEISEIYKNLYPNKVIYVIHTSCRCDKKHPYVTSNELAHDFENITMKEIKRGFPVFRAAIEGYTRKNRYDAIWNIGVPGYTHRQIHPSLFLQKSPDVSKNCDDDIHKEDEDDDVNTHENKRIKRSGGRRKTYRKKTQRKTHKRKYLNKKSKKSI